ncbi:hypothetical protein AMTR_s00124p00121570 [Amborella trichopoda]|uniref:Uncharacterized protein n=1 Tax=Amborella trichopoda TaxID=13333 RepID=W1NR49_AMBTC|nr:hypothetical protein AMTR_s00124p00121570 [Amborella trichopoda]
MQSLTLSPAASVTSGEGFALSLVPEKHTKMRASPSPILLSETTVPSVQGTMPAIVVTQMKTEPFLAERPTELTVVQSLTLSSWSQGDRLCTITEEGDILADGEASYVEVAVSGVSTPAFLETEPQLDFPSSVALELMVVSSSGAPISTIAHEAGFASTEVVPEPCVPSALTSGASSSPSQEPIVMT